MTNEEIKEIKAKLRRAAAYLQGKDTTYFSDRAKLQAILLGNYILDSLGGE